jgi:hypothetical protein
MVSSRDGSVSTVRAASTIRAPAGKVAAFMFGSTGYYYMLTTDAVFSNVIEQQNDCQYVIHHRQRPPKPLRDRDLVLHVV